MEGFVTLMPAYAIEGEGDPVVRLSLHTSEPVQ